MTANAYREALSKARADMDELLRKREACDKRIAALQTTINALSTLSRSTDHPEGIMQIVLPESGGITAAIRAVLRQSHAPMTAPRIRDTLRDLGYDIDRYTNILTVIHNNVKRMHGQGELSIGPRSGGQFGGWLYQKPINKAS